MCWNRFQAKCRGNERDGDSVVLMAMVLMVTDGDSVVLMVMVLMVTMVLMVMDGLMMADSHHGRHT